MIRSYRQFARLGLNALLLVGMAACHDEEEIYLPEPTIEFQGVEFREAFYNYPDTLVIKFIITDGDEDVGLDFSPSHLEFPYQLAYYYQKSDAKPVPSDKLERNEIYLEDLITFEEWQNGAYETLPSNDCDQPHSGTVGPTALYRTINENYWNFFLDVQYENPDGSFSTFDFSEYCMNYNDRIPSFSGNKKTARGGFEIDAISSKKAHVSYTVLTTMFDSDLGSKKLKIRIRVKDRALNESNLMETPEFFLDEI